MSSPIDLASESFASDNITFRNEENSALEVEETVEELLQRAENLMKSHEHLLNNTVTTEPTVAESMLGSAISDLVVESDVSTILDEAQAALDSLRDSVSEMQRNVPSSDVNISVPIEIDSDDDVVFVPHSRAVGNTNPHNISIVDLCSPPSDTSRRQQTVLENPYTPIQNAVMCPICMDSAVGKRPHTTQCGHIFCGDCIKESMRINKKCPSCNKKLAHKMIYPIYI